MIRATPTNEGTTASRSQLANPARHRAVQFVPELEIGVRVALPVSTQHYSGLLLVATFAFFSKQRAAWFEPGSRCACHTPGAFLVIAETIPWRPIPCLCSPRSTRLQRPTRPRNCSTDCSSALAASPNWFAGLPNSPPCSAGNLDFPYPIHRPPLPRPFAIHPPP